MAPLTGIRVVDVSRLLPGGFCSMLLSDLGAEVIKVEQPGLGDYMRNTPPLKRVSMVHAMVNRNKRSLGLNLKSAEGKRILRMLLRRSDVFLDGFRPGVMDRLGFSFSEVSRLNPSIVYCSISAFGRKSPMSKLPGHDLNFQAMAGSLGPMKPQVPLIQYSDYCAAMYASIGILAALVRRPRSAVLIDVPIVQSLMSLFVLPASAYFTTGKPNRLGSSLILGSEPVYNLYETLDKKYVAVATIEEEFWRNLLKGLGMSELAEWRHGSVADRKRLRTELGRAFAKKTREEWCSILMKGDTCVTPVLEVEEALDSDWSVISGSGRGRVEKRLRLPIAFRPSYHNNVSAAPSLGEHTREILDELGFSNKAINELARSGAVSN